MPPKPQIQGVAIGLSITLVACTAAHRAAAPLDVDRLVAAVAQVESGGRNCKPYWDVNAYRWGVFAISKVRWVEIGGRADTWGKASPDLQRKLVRKALASRCRSFETVARYWNGAGKAHFKYAVKLAKAYRSAK